MKRQEGKQKRDDIRSLIFAYRGNDVFKEIFPNTNEKKQ